MGCASSTPMIQTTGSEMLKAATHVASDASKTAEEAVEGVKDSVGKTLETAKDSVATTVESVKHEVENVVKDKSEMLEDAKNTLMEKLHLKPTECESKDNNDTNNSSTSSNKDEEHIGKKETDELKTQLNENVSSGPDGNDEDDATKKTNSSLDESIEVATKDIKDNILTRTDTEIDSLKTTTPETEMEIEQAFAKSHDKSNHDDDDNKPPTAKSNLSELENLTAEALKMQQHQDEVTATTKMVNDISMINNNDPLITEILHDNIKSLHSSNIMSLIADNNTTKDNEPATVATTTTNSDIKSNNMHKTAKIPTAVPAKTTKTHSHSHHSTQPPPLFPLTLATTAIATATAAATPAQPRVLKETEHKKLHATVKATTATKIQTTQEPIHSNSAIPIPPHSEVEKVKKSKVHKKEEKVNSETEEKRPGTTEWEKFADMLAQVRKFNPHDALRRGGTFSKFSTGGIGQLRERPSYLGHHIRGGMDDDSSDTTSNFRGSPLNSQRSSARTGGRVQRLPNRPNTGNSRKNNHEFSGFNGGGRYNNKTRRSSAAGRKFDFNPLRSRVHEYVSSTPFITNSLQTTSVTTQMPYAPNSFANESVKSLANMRSNHSRSDTRTLPPLESLEITRSRSQHEPLTQNHQQYNYFNNHPSQQQYQQQQQQHFRNDYPPNDNDNSNNNSSSMLLQSDLYNHEMPLLIRQSSNTSLFSNGSCVENVHNFKSSHQDVRLLTTNPPVKNTSSFLTTPRSSPFSIRKSYTDLYFSATASNKENKPQVGLDLCSRDKSPYKIRKRCDVCCKKYAIK